jgi:hypothetical protein
MPVRPAHLLVALALAACATSDSSGLPSFEMPEAWRAAGVAVDTVSADMRYAYGHVGQVVRYLYQPRDSTIAPQALLVTLIHSRPDWLALAAEEGPPPGDSIWGTADSLVVVALAQSNPFVPGTPDAARFDSLNLSLDRIKALFRR